MGDSGKSRILIVGATGHLGQWIARASVALLHPTFALVRSPTIFSKPELIHSFTTLGITILQGSLEDYQTLLAAVKQVDIVISAVKGQQFSDQINLVAAIKEAGKIKRFLPSEFGLDVDRAQVLDCLRPMFKKKAHIRRVTEEAGIPYTYICSFLFGEYYVKTLAQPGRLNAPPTDKLIIYGDGNTKGVYLCEQDIGNFIIKAADDPRTMNKVVHLRFPGNILSQNELVAIWERKLGKSLEKEFMSEEDMIKMVEAEPFTWENAATAMKHAIFVKGSTYNFQMGPHDEEAAHIYPNGKYIKVDDYLETCKESCN